MAGDSSSSAWKPDSSSNRVFAASANREEKLAADMTWYGHVAVSTRKRGPGDDGARKRRPKDEGGTGTPIYLPLVALTPPQLK